MKAKFIYESLTDLFKPKSKEDIVRYLSELSQNDLNYKLIDASRNGLTSVIQYLIDAGADVNAKTYVGHSTSLIYAAKNGYKDIVKILIDNGGDVNAKDKNGFTPLMYASSSNNNDIIELLKKHGAKLSDLSRLSQKELNYLLIIASINGITSAIQYLIDAGADVNVKDIIGNTPLIYASWDGYKDTVQILINNGADVNIKNNERLTALLKASWNSHTDIVQLLKKYGAKE